MHSPTEQQKKQKGTQDMKDKPSARNTHQLYSKKKQKDSQGIKDEPWARTAHILDSKKIKNQSEHERWATKSTHQLNSKQSKKPVRVWNMSHQLETLTA